jgi:sugar phosphate isomerase/epimerase
MILSFMILSSQPFQAQSRSVRFSHPLSIKPQAEAGKTFSLVLRGGLDQHSSPAEALSLGESMTPLTMKSNPLLSRRQFLTHTAVAGAALAAGLPAAQAQPGKKYPIIGFSKPFQNLSFDDTADFVARVGWDGIECPVRPKGQIEPERAPDELPRLVEALKKRHLELSIVTTAIRSAADPLTEKVLRTVSKLGIKRYRLGFWKYRLDQPIPPQLKAIAAELRELAALNKELGLQAGFQNHSGRDYVGAPVWDLHAMMKDLDPKQMGVCFDIGHATLEGGYAWPINARLIEPHFSAVFVKDFAWQKTDKGWRAQWCPLGDGMVNRAFFNDLKKSAFAGPIAQHHEYPLGNPAEMLAALQKDLKVLKEWLE